MKRVVHRYAVPDRQRAVIAPLRSGQETDRGVRARDNRRFFHAGLWILRPGAPWAELPERFGKFHSVCRRFRRLAQKGVWEAVFEALKEPDLEWVMRDSTILRAHQHAAGPKKAAPKPSAEAVAGAG